MNQARDDDGKASLLQAFIDAIALRTHDDEGDDDSRLSGRCCIINFSLAYTA